ncbi:hypothetical protein SAMN03159341_108155 [Paenibacillus sp. 1_12]|uniref:hypothetical protein n=1 Tax=Paenibacillus sp. 1_12 TaxID=1566278 RepID=UPI0008F27C65|nr:hypothetical protein [Paenibacillus sp. 1_12]SFL67153.1 hypothetical protein SAMN03159341_108155 [Paenibacillus sp. 1_12]
MKNKIAAHFRPSRRTSHTFERLKQCKGCGSYSSLWDNTCINCGIEGKFTPLLPLLHTILKRHAQRDVLILGTGALAAIVLGKNLMEMLISLLAGIALIVLYVLLRKKYTPHLEKSLLNQLLQSENRTIREGLLLDTEDAAADLKAENYKQAYEKLREIGYLFSGNQVKILKIICLNHFNLRKDMDLELSTLLPEAFDADFVLYLFEVSKVSPELVKRDAIDYVIRYRPEIEALPGGRAALALVFTAALRVKTYVVQYQDQIADFIDDLPRERLIRLLQLVAESPDSFPQLYPRLTALLKQKYEADPELQGII